MSAGTLTELMRAAGIVQEGDPALLEVARDLVLPDEADEALGVVEALEAAAERVAAVHVFAKGLGVAAPQIGIRRAVAIVRLPEGGSITLFNPVVVEQSTQTDEQYEGCLSFFDVRGLVPRPLALHVEHQTVEGPRHVSVFERGLARLVAHEIDHLTGTLYRERMRPGTEPISVTEYRGSGAAWKYTG
ncbi:formylmethionine deformylase [Streptomyces lunaelactis]|uniref:Peptide deformylase n=2 Tax=Streptomyces lunaelactis TaxID=1535768 RepID=A0A2R4TE20_9ACTN|nr:formylmethionine deformylase [Streptomyces lunaelactis]NUK85534.1 peptide deformylase [Streptomyces lunaelactis]